MRLPAIQFVFDPRAFDRAIPRPAVWVLAAIEPIRDAACRLIAAHLDVDPAVIVLAKDPHGRLFVDAARMPACPRAAEVDISVSHAAGIQVIGVAFGGRIGVDVEVIDAGIDIAALSRDQFTASEQAQLAALAPPDRIRCFYHLWTAKEAVAKAIGHGFSFGMDAIDAIACAGGDGAWSCRISRIAGSAAMAAGWNVTHRMHSHHGQPILIAAAIGGAAANGSTGL